MKTKKIERYEGEEDMEKIQKRNCEEVHTLNDKELNNINGGGGFAVTANLNTQSAKYIHNNCGGEILNVGNLFAKCKCQKCGMKYYWLYSFDYSVEFEDQTN